MGQPMAHKLLDAGHVLTIYDINEAAMRPLISLWGRALTIAGHKPGAAQVLKLTNNILSAISLAATAEAFVMGAKGGLDPEVMLAAINAGSGRNSATEDKFPPLRADPQL